MKEFKRKPAHEVMFWHKDRVFRMHPLATVFWAGLLAIIFGAHIPAISFLIVPGLVVVAVYVAYFITWLVQHW